MKKIITIVSMLITFITMIVTANAKDIRILLDGNDVYFDVAPQIINDRTLVPMRAIFEALSYSVEWNQNTQEIKATGSQGTIEMKIGNYAITKNGQYIMTDIAPQVINNRTLIPIRAISEVLGYTVTWDGDNQIIYIDSQNKILSIDEAKQIVLSKYGGTWVGREIGAAHMYSFNYNGKDYYHFAIKGYVDNHSTTLNNVIIATDNSEMFDGEYNPQKGTVLRY